MPKLTRTQKDQIAAVFALAIGGPEHVSQSDFGNWMCLTDNSSMWPYSTFFTRRTDGRIIQAMETLPETDPDFLLGEPSGEGTSPCGVDYTVWDSVDEYANYALTAF